MKTTLSFFLFLSFSLFCYGQNFPEKFEDNAKFGIKYHEKIMLSAVYDEIITYPLIIAVKEKERTIYDNKMSLLHNNSDILTYVYLDEHEKLQVLTKNGKLFSYNDNGLITDILKLNPNETINNVNKDDSQFGYHRYSIKNRKIYENHRGVYFNENFNFKVFGTKTKFLNNKKKMEIEYLYRRGVLQDTITRVIFDEEIYFEPLKTNYIVSKMKGKYGVWDFVNQKIILSYDYEKIIPYHNYLMIKKNKLYTFYPNIGTKPKYKKLEPYIGYFARFETIDDKKGWVDRKGKEYFDE